MKYIKTYEKLSNIIIIYWKVRTDKPYLEISLDKLKSEYGCDINYDDYTDLKEFDKVYIILLMSSEGNTWRFCAGEFRKDYETKYLGEVEVTDDDIYEYNLRKTQNKYNL